MNYYIWSIEHNQWWKSNGCGYTSDRSEAGIYAEAQAIEICEDANLTISSLTSNFRPCEAMVPAFGKDLK